ncbi:hypothetical protein LCGC14_2852510, partial [marine sediment metagenome]
TILGIYKNALDIIKEDYYDVEIKKVIVKNNIYGVDINPNAIEIARLRLWLWITDSFDPENIEPLPNIDFNLRVGNSLIGLVEKRVIIKDQALIIDNIYKSELEIYTTNTIGFSCKPMYQTLRELGLFGSERKNVPSIIKEAIELAKNEVQDKDMHWSETSYGKIAHAWLLGFYDGDGTHQGGYSAAVGSSSKKLLQEIKDLFGSPNPVLTTTEPATEVMVFDKLTISTGYYGLTL